MSPTPSNGTAPGGHGGPDNENNGQCELLGPFALVVQAALGGLALLSLVYKRWRERPQRPVKVWAFDASKQVFGSGLLHLANLVMSIFSADQTSLTAKSQTNPCSFYLLNLGIDTTIGIPILILILRVVNYAAQLTPLANPPESIESGNYGDPPSGVWWLKQSFIYFIGLLGMKACVFFLIQVLPFIVEVGDWALKWTEGNTAMQIFFVMLLFPVIMNAVQYYIIDIFIKKPVPKGEEGTSTTRDPAGIASNGREDRNALLGDLENDSDSDCDETIEVEDQFSKADDESDRSSLQTLRTSNVNNEERNT
ncbi:hypothetical protein FQN54_001007 [Arachnomyces sp. PD_36]|nr:hypothetical protein FQN54_001007 [Arachnomyces sp. PD_36]